MSDESNHALPSGDGTVHEDRLHPQLQKYFKAMVASQAADLHLKVGRQANFRIGSELRATTKEEPITDALLGEMVDTLLSPAQQEYFRVHGNVDLAYEMPGSDRFRINIFRQRGMVGLVARRVTREIPTFEQLHLPPLMNKIIEANQGLILLAGPTGSGKSTTISAMLEQINQTRRCHIITIEDPIEFLYEDKQALVTQREIGIDVPNFTTALRSMLREDPDVILIGEMRDHETFEAALQASETGHLVFGTIHASTAAQTIPRILELFPQASRALILQSLAFSLKAIVCQKLLPSVKEDIGRVPAVEVLQNSPTVRQLLENGRENELADVIRANEGDNMLSFTQSLYDLIHNDMVDPKVAYAAAPNAEDLKRMVKGITQSRTGLVGRRG